VADEVLPFSGDRGEGTPVARGGNGIWGAGGRAAGPAGGEDLGALLRRRGRLPAGRTAVLVSQVAAALDAAHDAGLVHGSVTPASIVVSPGEGGRAVLTDAGTVRPGGTLDYLAPEQIEGIASGPQADQYALACVAYEMLGGEPPFRRGDDLSLLRGQFAQTPLPLTSLRPDLPPETDLVLARAMAREPGDRYHRCLDFAEFTQGLGTTARDTLIVLSVNEDTVTARLVAVQTDGSVRTYQGTYVVRDGVIAQASVRQID